MNKTKGCLIANFATVPTVNNEAHLRAQIIRRFGFIPEGIRVMTWFEFLHGFCFRPFLQ
ncbi:DNA helicase UvrD, partial [Klebsiella variicola subsp. variicola]|nr:DNA helicase UvrD [Klebsiella variicola subsp. variicola]